MDDKKSMRKKFRYGPDGSREHPQLTPEMVEGMKKRMSPEALERFEQRQAARKAKQHRPE